jgi:hypothetical protein
MLSASFGEGDRTSTREHRSATTGRVAICDKGSGRASEAVPQRRDSSRFLYLCSAIVDQELEIGLLSIAVPLRDSSGTVVAAPNASTHAQRVSTQEVRTRFLPALLATAQELALLLAPGVGARSFAPPPAH